MHITAWRNGRAFADWDMSQYGSTAEGQRGLVSLVTFLNRYTRETYYELSLMGEAIASGGPGAVR